VPFAARHWSLERAVQAAIVATIVCTVLASGSLLSWISVAQKLRWAALFALVGLAAAWAVRARAELVRPMVLALAASFLALAFVSVAWSVDRSATVGRGAGLTLVFVVAIALACVARGRTDTQLGLLYALVAAAGAVCVGGLLVLLFRYDRAIAAATPVLPARYQGLGGGPNTATMLLAVAFPPTVHVALRDRSRALRLGAAAVALGSLASIVASGSRGALVAAFVGTLVLALVDAGSRRAALRAAAVVVAVFALGAALSQVPDPGGPGTPAPDIAADPYPPDVSAAAPYVWVDTVLRLQDDVGRSASGGVSEDEGRPLLGSSGRLEAWDGALAQAAARPLLGYGFGTEPAVFVDRYVGFNSGVPENSYLGLLLQLGVVGLAALLALVAVLVVPVVRASRRLDTARRGVAAACAGAVAAGLVLAVVQSFVYAPGNVATLAFWISAFLLAALLP
jgi:O-antigen ligase